MLKNGKMKRINIFEGSVRSGKTYISMIVWGFWVAGSPKNKAYLMAGKTLQTLKRNVLEPMTELFHIFLRQVNIVFKLKFDRQQIRIFVVEIVLFQPVVRVIGICC